ncbi:hypothetical protein KM043_010401 [Ampulex compressa]|nr:hypothetical protein KM043_010401 [Ampulex compressa]
MIVSPSMSLIAAGVASGICFILFSSARKGKSSVSQSKKDRIPVDDSRCGCCLKPFLITRGVECDDCGARSCRKGCSRWDTSDNVWRCLFCHQQRSWLKRNEKWFDTFGGPIDEEELHRFFSTAKSRVYVAGVENAAAGTSADLAAENRKEAYAMETVRDLIEKIVEGLVGNVDDTPIDRLYDHPEYDKLLAKYTVPMAGVLARLSVSLQLSLASKFA